MALIGMVVALFIVTALVVAMMSQSTSSFFSLAHKSSGKRAFYLAESGFRYAAAHIKNDADLKDDLHLHPPFSLTKNAGSFDLFLFPHHLITTGLTAAGSTELKVETPGGYDSGSGDALTFPGGSVKKIRIVSESVNYDKVHDYGTVALTDLTDAATGKHTAEVTFKGINPPISQALLAGATILTVAQGIDENQTISEGGDLSLKAGTATAFPKRNGTFRIPGDPVLYRYAEKDDTTSTLKNIDSPLEDSFTPFEVSSGANLFLERFVRIKSVGKFQDTTRTLTYHMPMATPEATVTFEDRFDDPTLSNWQAASQGTFVAPSGKLEVAGTTPSAAGEGAQIQLKAGAEAPVDLERSWKYGNRGYLSYDAQVKVGFDPIPDDDYMAGLSFRVSDTTATTEKKQYGLSFMCADEVSSISKNLVPTKNSVHQTGKELLVFWQQTGPGDSDLTWLAYKDMNPTFYYDDMEPSGSSTKTSLFKNEKQIILLSSGWEEEASWGITSESKRSGQYSYHDSPSSPYGNDWDRSLISPQLSLNDVNNATLLFWHRYNILEEPDEYGTVEIYTNKSGSGIWHPIPTKYSGSQDDWAPVEIDLSPYLPASDIRIKFRLRTNASGTADGWYIDDVTISKRIPIQNSTLVARVQESPIIAFKGKDLEGRGIQNGDTVCEVGGGWSCRVDGDPIITSGDWTSGVFGILSLRNLNEDGDPPTTGDAIRVIGATADATVLSYSNKENLIRAFIGDKIGEGTPNGSGLDYIKAAHPVDTIRWPPANVTSWTASQDYFTLVQWDDVNPSTHQDWSDVEGGSAISKDSFSWISSIDEPGAIIRTNTLVTPDLAEPFSRSELGLHAFGSGATNVYFDDFAVRLKIGAKRQYVPVVQQ